MTNLRAAKVAKIADYIPHQTVYGDPEGDLLVVGWGGTRGHLQNAVDKMRAEGKKVSLCHFNYINPLPHGVADIFKRFKKIVVSSSTKDSSPTTCAVSCSNSTTNSTTSAKASRSR